MLQSTEKNEDGLRNVPQHEAKNDPYPPRWSDTLSQTHSGMVTKVEAGGSYDIPFSLSMKGEHNEMGLNEFPQGNGFITSEQWSKFSHREAPLQGYRSGFPPVHKTPSPPTSESATPPSLSSSLQSSGHESFPPYYQSSLSDQGQHLHLPNSHSYQETFTPQSLSRGEETWPRDYNKIGGANKVNGAFPALGLGIGINPGLGLPKTLPPTSVHASNRHGNGFNFSSQALHDTVTHMNPSGFSGSGHFSPPQTASTSSASSGSSSPSLRGEMYDRGNWKYPPNATQYGTLSSQPSTQPMDWQSTCDPRGICHERDMHGMLPIQPPHPHSQSPDDSDGSEHRDLSNDGGKRIKMRSRRIESGPYDWGHGHRHGLAKSMLIGSGANVDMIYRIHPSMSAGPGVKKKEEMLGMGLEDINEAELQFTSRQDTKPTRLLRRQCFNCSTWRDVSAWRRSIIEVGHIVCNKCGLYEKAHKRSRPLNDRGEFVRPGKHPTTKPPAPRPVTKPRPVSGVPSGEAILRFDNNREADKEKPGMVKSEK